MVPRGSKKRSIQVPDPIGSGISTGGTVTEQRAGDRDRTDDLRFTKPLLCRLSYSGDGARLLPSSEAEVGAGVQRSGGWARSRKRPGLRRQRSRTCDGSSRGDVEALDRAAHRDAGHEVTPFACQPREPAALGTQDDDERPVGHVESEDVSRPSRVEPHRSTRPRGTPPIEHAGDARTPSRA